MPSNTYLATMKVFYRQSDQEKLSDPSFKFYADDSHPDLKGHNLFSTGYIGPVENIVFNNTVPVVQPATVTNKPKPSTTKRSK